jgi:hypothetical protein
VPVDLRGLVWRLASIPTPNREWQFGDSVGQRSVCVLDSAGRYRCKPRKDAPRTGLNEIGSAAMKPGVHIASDADADFPAVDLISQ